MKLHAAVGAAMLAHAGLREEATWVRHHHERLDGGGYPDGIAGDDIPLEARIIFVADSFEAMTSDRPYRAGMAVDDAVAELRRCAGAAVPAGDRRDARPPGRRRVADRPVPAPRRDRARRR